MFFTRFVFVFTALVMLISAVFTVSVRKMLHAALWLILSLFCVGVLFILLENPFFGIVQLLVYIGAIAIMMIFAIMLTRRMMYDDSTQFTREKWIGLAATVVIFLVLSLVILSFCAGLKDTSLLFGVEGTPATIAMLGQSLVSPDGYLLPFEVASILLLAALIGAIFIGREKKPQE
jgi:NADH-quinone oxidoreductase subunit J